CLLFCYSFYHHLLLPSFPTRRSSDLTIFETAGSYTWDFYYPYPDYKFPMTIYSDKWLPGIGELREVRYNFDRARLRLFDETRVRSEEHTSELQSRFDLVCRLLLEKKK